MRQETEYIGRHRDNTPEGVIRDASRQDTVAIFGEWYEPRHHDGGRALAAAMARHPAGKGITPDDAA